MAGGLKIVGAGGRCEGEGEADEVICKDPANVGVLLFSCITRFVCCGRETISLSLLLSFPTPTNLFSIALGALEVRSI